MHNIAFFFLLLIIMFALFGLSQRSAVLSRHGSNYINPRKTHIRPMCQHTQVHCHDDNDCGQCNDLLQMTCQKMTRGSSIETDTYGRSGSYCLPQKPKKPCNEKLGGVWTWAGWAGGRKEWDCLCAYPHIAANKGCTRLNPDVCRLGKYSYDAQTSKRAPNPSDCKCNDQKIVTEAGVPLCIRKNDNVPRHFYGAN